MTIWIVFLQTPSFCEGIKFLTVITSISYFAALYYWILRDNVIEPILSTIKYTIRLQLKKSQWLEKNSTICIWSLIIACVASYAVYVSIGQWYRLVSGFGVIGFVIIGFAFSEHRSDIKWTQVLWGLAMQFSLALLVLRTDFGRQLFRCLGDKISDFLKFTDAGSSFLFGQLVTGNAEHDFMPVFAFKVWEKNYGHYLKKCRSPHEKSKMKL